ncbi:MAG: 50S ribosomal protein L4 [Rhodospirillales bacterium]|jgi:large subunit ribosomal protein L4|nr:50S ribosomal protein L4 [Rhodospirillales bacterium]MBT4627209.1 50S ribosomal protein L4 [Rhodospirillales bacterium]MBT5351601.1 50S ribosomal protein L4 [Rhodospirillales bacterium]MBT5519660.1 50S ribosomal protein L4 [Rhodospirillales bacterium]MBT6109980.1 50S ribosomal protein L4 [Rhodospirillales bacterium]
MKCDVITLDNKKDGNIDLDDAIFGVDVRGDLMARYVNWQLAKRRAGTHKTKGRSEVAATRAKPFKQKGTGRARQGTFVAPQMRGGGIVFGPVVRDHGNSLPKKVRKAALRSALSSKQAEGKLIVLDAAEMKKGKTKELIAKLDKLGWGNALVIDGETVDVNFSRAASNIVGLDVLPSQGANVYDILRRDTLVLTKSGVEKLVERLK